MHHAAQAQTGGPTAAVKVSEIEGIAHYRFANGLQLLLLSDPAKPITTVNLTVLAGSRHENYGETGMAHLLEHLVFKGSPTHPNPMLAMTSRGLRWNGTTSYDRTNYFASFSASEDTLAWYLQWQADAMVNSYIARKDLDTEMAVVRNEFERGENDAEYMLRERMLSAAYQWHNYGKTVIGARTDIEQVNIARLRAFYQRYYQPDNAVLIITGSFDTAKTLSLVQSTFGNLPRPDRQLPAYEMPVHYTLDAAQDGERQVTVRRSGGVPMVAVYYHAMAGADPDFTAIRLLSSILGSEPQGRIYRALSDKKLAASVLGIALDQHDPGGIGFRARLTTDSSTDAARAELLRVLDTAADGREPITQQELDLAKLQADVAFQQMWADTASISFGLSEAVASGDWRLLLLHRDRVKNVQLQDVQRVANTWLVRDNRTVGTYLPTAAPQRAPTPVFVDLQAQLQGFAGQQTQAQAKVAAFDPELGALNAKVERFALDNGMKVALLPKESRSGKVRALLTLRYGTAQSLAPLSVSPLLALGMLDKGTQDLSRIALAFKALTLGVSDLNVSMGSNSIHIAIQGNGDKIAELTPLIVQVLRYPAFAPDEFDKFKADQIARLESQRGSPDAVAFNAMEQLVNPYPRDDIRSVQELDTRIAELKASTVQQAQAFHRDYFGGTHAELVLVGAFDAAQAKQQIEKAFGDWKTTQPYAPIRYQHLALTGSRQVINTPDKKSATYVANLPMPVGEAHGDFLALQIASMGLSKRLLAKVRQQQGLSYKVASWLQMHPYDDVSHWRIYASFAPQNLAKVEAAVAEELKVLNDKGLTDSEVQEAVTQWLESSRQARANDKSLAYLVGDNLDKNRGFDWQASQEAQVKRLTAGQVNLAIATYCQPEKWTRVIAGDWVPPQ